MRGESHVDVRREALGVSERLDEASEHLVDAFYPLPQARQPSPINVSEHRSNLQFRVQFAPYE